MKFLVILLLLLMKNASAQDFLSDIEKIHKQIGKDEVDSYIKNPTSGGLSGSFLKTITPRPPFNPQGDTCDLLELDKKSKPQYEIVLITENRPKLSSVEVLPGQRAQFNTVDLHMLQDNVPYTMESYGFKSEAILARSNDIWNSKLIAPPSETFDPHSKMGQEIFIEGLVQASAKSTLGEKELTKKMADIIKTTYGKDEERFNALSALSLRLYRNYNTARNPGYDNPKNNPFAAVLPKGDMSANDIVKAASAFNVFQGGVCNDISETVAMVGEHLFPDKDVLTVNSGSHFGVVVADGKQNRVIDGGDQYVQQNQLFLDPKMTPTNLRISQVQNGALREIAVVDTEMGQLMEKAFQTGKNLLKTDADIPTMIAQFKSKHVSFAAGTGELSDSKVVVVVAKYEDVSDTSSKYIGIGLTEQDFNTQIREAKYQVHITTGAETNVLRYVNENTNIKFTTGARAAGMYTLNPYKDPNVAAQKADLSVSVDLVNRVSFEHNQDRSVPVRVKGYLETEHTLGPTNWGNTTGALSYMNWGDTGTLLKNVSFHLNQVNADVTAEKRLPKGAMAVLNAHYQGSNIGQKVDVLAGIDIKVLDGAKIFIFTGYTKADLKGYKTKNSLLASQGGGMVGLKLTNKRGSEMSINVRGVAGKPSVGTTIKIPLNNR
jgi:hypothetical protein